MLLFCQPLHCIFLLTFCVCLLFLLCFIYLFLHVLGFGCCCLLCLFVCLFGCVYFDSCWIQRKGRQMHNILRFNLVSATLVCLCIFCYSFSNFAENLLSHCRHTHKHRGNAIWIKNVPAMISFNEFKINVLFI